MFDFGCAARDEGGVSGRNNKGLVTMDRKTRKASFYIYKAYWNKTPMVHLCGKRYAQRAGETTEIRVYSNQPTVALYLNGELVEEKTESKVFVFKVSLKDGFNTLMAVAGDVKDTMTLEKVDEEPSIYVLPVSDDDSEGVANWFTQMGDLDLAPEMTFPEGKLSIKSKISSIYANQDAWNMFKETMQLPDMLSPENGMWGMISNFTVELMLSMGGKNIPEAALAMLNAKLIEFDEVDE